MIRAMVEFPAAVVARHRAGDRPDTVDDCETIGTNVSVGALHFPPFERKCVKWLLAWDAQVVASDLPLNPMRLDPAAAAALVGDQVRQLVLESAPKFIRLDLFKLWVQLDRAVWPPSPARRGLHPWVPRDADPPRQVVQGQRF